MIRHNILFKVKPNIPNDEIERVINVMCSHERSLSGIFSIIGGECQFHDEKSTNFFMHHLSKGASHCISIDFFDRNTLEEFFKNPDLINAKNEIIDITIGGLEGVVAFDLENPDI